MIRVDVLKNDRAPSIRLDEIDNFLKVVNRLVITAFLIRIIIYFLLRFDIQLSRFLNHPLHIFITRELIIATVKNLNRKLNKIKCISALIQDEITKKYICHQINLKQ